MGGRTWLPCLHSLSNNGVSSALSRNNLSHAESSKNFPLDLQSEPHTKTSYSNTFRSSEYSFESHDIRHRESFRNVLGGSKAKGILEFGATVGVKVHKFFNKKKSANVFNKQLKIPGRF